MAELPEEGTDSGYMSDATRTESEMQTAMENVYDVIAEIGSKAPTTRALSGNSFTDPVSSMVLVTSEGAGSSAPDDLDNIVPTNVTPGRYLLLKNSDTATTVSGSDSHVTVKHNASGTGEIYLSGGVDFVLCADRMLLLILTSTSRWDEVHRYYGRKNAEDILEERTFLGLGDSSVETIATAIGSTGSKILKVGSSNLSTNDILSVDSSGNIITGTVTGGNADTLESLGASSFVRTDSTSAQTMVANLTVDKASGAATITTDTADSSSTSGISLVHNGNERGSVFVDTSDGMVELRSKSAVGANTPAIRLNPGSFTNTHTSASYNGSIEFNDAPGSGTWEHIRPGAGFGLDADMLDGSQLTDIIHTIYHNYISAGDEYGTDTRGYIILGKEPNRLQITWGGVHSTAGDHSRRTFEAEFADPPVICGLVWGLWSNATRRFTIQYYPTVTETYYQTRTIPPWPGAGDFSEPEMPPLIAIGKPA